jgi:Rieske Fe-S protein
VQKMHGQGCPSEQEFFNSGLFLMSNNQPVDKDRRVWMIACGAAGGVAAGATGVTLLSTLSPSERAKAAGAPVEVDLSGMKPGDMKTVEWRGQPVWIVRRGEKTLKGCQAMIPSWLTRSQSTSLMN